MSDNLHCHGEFHWFLQSLKHHWTSSSREMTGKWKQTSALLWCQNLLRMSQHQKQLLFNFFFKHMTKLLRWSPTFSQFSEMHTSADNYCEHTCVFMTMLEMKIKNEVLWVCRFAVPGQNSNRKLFSGQSKSFAPKSSLKSKRFSKMLHKWSSLSYLDTFLSSCVLATNVSVLKTGAALIITAYLWC